LEKDNILGALMGAPYRIARDTTIDNYNYLDGWQGPAVVSYDEMDQLATAITNLQQPYNLFGKNCQHLANILARFAVGQLTYDQALHPEQHLQGVVGPAAVALANFWNVIRNIFRPN
jgi:hypothetical protein